jgi:alpha-D-ribose 1-methylphosphonate 5-triphosphate synthase subunit PhnG
MPNWKGNNVLLFGFGIGKNKQIAQQNAASDALSKNEGWLSDEENNVKNNQTQRTKKKEKNK